MPASGSDGAADAGTRDGAKDIGVYVHWPFCRSKCPYCDFNSHVAEAVDHRRWRRALISELNHFALSVPDRRVASIFFGGGTPSLMDPETVHAVVEQTTKRWAVARDPEVTLEANPSSAERGKFRDFRAAGVNRLSVGVQSFRDDRLGFLGRGHSATDARAAVAAAGDVFERVSFDLIYGLPGETAADWRGELTRALDLAGGHLSVYQLAVEPGTAFFRDGIEGAGEDRGAVLYAITGDVLAGAGLPAYEVSNHARPGSECRHNLHVWRGGDYVGVGPGAHGRLRARVRTEATYQVHAPDRWLDQVERKGHATAKRRVLSRRQRAEEVLMTGLRLAQGIGRAGFESATGRALDDVVDAAQLDALVAGGFLETDDAGLRATPRGVIRLDAVLGRLLAGE